MFAMAARLRRARQPKRQSDQAPHGAGARLREAERLFADFAALTPYEFVPVAKSFRSFAAYRRWQRAQKNPWYR